MEDVALYSERRRRGTLLFYDLPNQDLLITGFQTTLEVVCVINLPKTGLEPTQACTY
jgi:hypothetical protein